MSRPETQIHPLHYPSSDGKPMADNTKQARWIISLYDNLESLFLRQKVFIAADLFWYPVEGEPRLVTAPDVMVVFGRPHHDRPSYQQWKEEDTPPQVVFEVISPSNTAMEMASKISFYQKHGVEELILIDPGKADDDSEQFIPHLRHDGRLVAPDFPQADWTSPRLQVRFRQEGQEVKLYYPDGSPFRRFADIRQELNEAQSEIERLKARLKELGEE